MEYQRWVLDFSRGLLQTESTVISVHMRKDNEQEDGLLQEFENCQQNEIRENSNDFHCRRTLLRRTSNRYLSEFHIEQKDDPDLADIVKLKMDHSERPSLQKISSKSQKIKSYWALWDSLMIQHGLLKRIWESSDGKDFKYQVIQPAKKVPEVLRALHNGMGSGHLGAKKTLKKVREKFFWLRSRADVEEWCKSCTYCAARKELKTHSCGRAKQYNSRARFEDNAGSEIETSKSSNRSGVFASHCSEQLHEIPRETRSKLQAKNGRMNICRNLKSNIGDFIDGERVRTHHSRRTSTHERSWRLYSVATRTNSLACRIQSHVKMKVVHPERTIILKEINKDRDDPFLEVKIWFQNRRTKWKKIDNISNAEAAEHKSTGPKSEDGRSHRNYQRSSGHSHSQSSNSSIESDSKGSATSTVIVEQPVQQTFKDILQNHTSVPAPVPTPVPLITSTTDDHFQMQMDDAKDVLLNLSFDGTEAPQIVI